MVNTTPAFHNHVTIVSMGVADLSLPPLVRSSVTLLLWLEWTEPRGQAAEINLVNTASHQCDHKDLWGPGLGQVSKW